MPHWSCSSIAFAAMTSYDLLFIAHSDSSWWITPLPRIRGGFFLRIRIQNLDNMECSWLSLNNLSVILHIASVFAYCELKERGVIECWRWNRKDFSTHSSLKYPGTIHNASYSALSTDNIIFGKVFSPDTYWEDSSQVQ